MIRRTSRIDNYAPSKIHVSGSEGGSSSREPRTPPPWLLIYEIDPAYEAEGRKLNPRGVMILTIYNASQVISKDANAGSAGSTTPVRYLSPKTNAFEVFLQFPHPKGLCQ